jgi:PilZ domain
VASGSDDRPPPTERRPKRRKRVLLAGIITYADGAYSFDCTIRDLSESGAQLVVGKNAQFPTDFFLINIRDRTAYDVSVVWNNGSRIGVTFKKIYPLSDIRDPSLNYLTRLWISKAAR